MSDKLTDDWLRENGFEESIKEGRIFFTGKDLQLEKIEGENITVYEMKIVIRDISELCKIIVTNKIEL